jgi:hypothetical protein
MATPIAVDSGTLVGSVRYNGFRFPPARKATASFEPVYDDANRVMKYLRASLHVEFWLFPGAADSITGAYAYSTTNLATSVGDVADAHTVDSTFEIVRQRLSEPGQPLYFTTQGLGTFSVQDGFTSDVDNGPKPKMVTWRPLSNKMCFVTWEVTTAIPNCTENSGNAGYAQFPFTVTFDINESGCNTRTIAGKLELPLTRTPNLGGVRADVSNPFDMETFQKRITSAFPMLASFRRKQRFQLSADRKTVDWSLVDTEIESDEAYGEGCIREEARLNISNKKDKVFGIWDTTLSGSVEVAAGFPKSFGWAEITRLFDKYVRVRSPRGADSKNGDIAGPIARIPSKRIDSRVILEKISFDDEIFGRRLGFTFRWTLFTTLDTLFDATGLFRPVRDSQVQQDQAWDKWRTSMEVYLKDGKGYQQLSFNNNDDVIVSLCDTWRQGTAEPTQPSRRPVRDTRDPDTGNQTPTRATENRAEDNSYSDYKSRFDVTVERHATTHTPLGDSSPEKDTADPTLPASTGNGKPYLPVKPQSSDKSGTPITKRTTAHVRRSPTVRVVHTGYAVRLNLAPAVPHVQSFCGSDVTPVGQDIIKIEQIGTGIDVNTATSHAIYGLMWRREYILQDTPTNDIIVSDGRSDMYV